MGAAGGCFGALLRQARVAALGPYHVGPNTRCIFFRSFPMGRVR